jgi:hypothetical protein
MRRNLVALALAASSLSATPFGLSEPLWSLLASLWGEPATKEGCGMDPWGRCNPNPQPEPGSEAGAGADPFG